MDYVITVKLVSYNYIKLQTRRIIFISERIRRAIKLSIFTRISHLLRFLKNCCWELQRTIFVVIFFQKCDTPALIRTCRLLYKFYFATHWFL